MFGTEFMDNFEKKDVDDAQNEYFGWKFRDYFNF